MKIYSGENVTYLDDPQSKVKTSYSASHRDTLLFGAFRDGRDVIQAGPDQMWKGTELRGGNWARVGAQEMKTRGRLDEVGVITSWNGREVDRTVIVHSTRFTVKGVEAEARQLIAERFDLVDGKIVGSLPHYVLDRPAAVEFIEAAIERSLALPTPEQVWC